MTTTKRSRADELREAERGDMLHAAREYLRRGWRVVPLRPGEKAPAAAHWPDLRLDEGDLPQWYGPSVVAGYGVGLLLGEASGGLVDVDCDTREAALAAAELLPPTGRVSSRYSNPSSHYWYVIAGELPRTAKFAFGEGQAEDAPTMLIELRSTGCQTLAPPSKHPSGERVLWERAREPGRVDGHTLRRACARVAAAALLARHWPAHGTRDEAALALAGFLLRGGLPVGEADHFAQTVAKAAGDEEWAKRGKAIQTVRALAEGRPVAGATKLAALLSGDGTRVVAQARAWLGLRDGRDGDADGGDSAGGRFGSSPGDLLGHIHDMTIQIADDHPNPDPLRDVLLSAVPRTRVRWLWQGRIPLGALTLLDGDPGLGKSLLTLDLVVRVTRGRAMPDGTPGVDGGALLLSAEDDLSATIAPRLATAGADLERVRAVRAVTVYDAESGRELERPFVLPGDIPHLAARVAQAGATLVVIDPLMAYLDARVNSWRDQDVRAALVPLAALAERTGAAVVILRHLTKGFGTNAIYRGGGSIGIIGAARAGLLVAKSPDDPEHERVLAPTKSNLGPPMPALRYRLVSAPDGPPRVEWLGQSDYTAATLLTQATAPDGEEAPSKREDAAAFLRAALADGPRLASEVQLAARAAGIRDETFRRAQQLVPIHREQLPQGAGRRGRGPVLWSLASDEPPGAGLSDESADLDGHPDLDGHVVNVTKQIARDQPNPPSESGDGEGAPA
jgi:AAA domain-containing protein/bifunctional DNA primase/polymerase-like protein